MTEKLTLEKANQLGAQQGAFVSLDMLRREYGLKPKVVNRTYAHFFRMLKPQVDEAQKELTHLHEVLKRMEHTCRRGSYERPVTIIIGSPLVSEFESELRALEGWVVSLFETYMSIYGFHIPQGVPGKIHELARASWDLWHNRQVQLLPFFKDRSQFEYMLSL